MTTGLYAALLALMFMGLTVNVVVARRKLGVAMGDKGEHELLRRTRAQGNFAESTPFFLILLALAEVQGMSAWAVHALGGVFVVGRVLHAYSLLKHERYRDAQLITLPRYRILGMMCTLNVLGALAVVLLWQWVSN
ncbi:MAG: MAPEG family protein [Rickettsiales bacterium]|nr:MAPEG family protein [Rickettsiales bacterium]